jgi:hypothetical protein
LQKEVASFSSQPWQLTGAAAKVDRVEKVDRTEYLEDVTDRVSSSSRAREAVGEGMGSSVVFPEGETTSHSGVLGEADSADDIFDLLPILVINEK